MTGAALVPQIRQGLAAASPTLIAKARRVDEAHHLGDGAGVWSTARLIVEKHGIRAPSYADHQALKARERGDVPSMHRWQSVAAATTEILRGEELE
ncbi:MAG: hypothetical protein ACREFQ_16330 [Stellaceae bacterium]